MFSMLIIVCKITWVSNVDWASVLSFHEANKAIHLKYWKQLICAQTFQCMKMRFLNIHTISET